MKYGLIYYKNTSNLGDDILSYAGMRFLPHVDYYIDREEMDLFLPEKDEWVGVIFNGWYLHHGYRFPPSPYIVPFFVGTHFDRNQMRAGDFSFFNDFVTAYLNEHGPVGCRDTQTMELMQKKKVDHYFSGCLTLTLEPFQGVQKSGNVILTDVSEAVTNYIRRKLPDKKIICKSHVIPAEKVGIHWREREQQVEDYLKMYQGAGLVITTRLHCMLPAIALGTPVILIGNYNEDYYSRLSDYAKLCPCFSEAEILGGKADFALERPQTQFEEVQNIRKNMIQACEGFIKALPDKCGEKKPVERDVYQSIYVERTVNMRRTIQSLLAHCIQIENEYKNSVEKLARLASISQEILQENERLHKLVGGGK